MMSNVSKEDSVHMKLHKCVGPVATSVGFAAAYGGRKRPAVASILENWRMMEDDGFGTQVQLGRMHLFFLRLFRTGCGKTTWS